MMRKLHPPRLSASSDLAMLSRVKAVSLPRPQLPAFTDPGPAG